MIIMDLKLDNLLCFNDFHMNFAYPKKIVNSFVDDEYLAGRPNFRYKKINIIMGSNATGKTSLGRIVMGIFNFIDRKNLDLMLKSISDKGKQASFSIDFVLRNDDKYVLYRVATLFDPDARDEYGAEKVHVDVRKTDIRKNDNYEMCAGRLDSMTVETADSYVSELDKVERLSWYFIFPWDKSAPKNYKISDDDEYLKILEVILRVLDPAINAVEKIEVAENSFVIKMNGKEIILQNGNFANEDLLSTGTKAGIEVANMITSICLDSHDFYYCDEKFSYVTSDIERALIALMVSKLDSDKQLFITSHNSDILDLPLPKHSYNFLRKEMVDGLQKITSVNAGDYLKKNTDSLRNAVENDLFSSAANLELLNEIERM